jgi:hypothetical protein
MFGIKVQLERCSFEESLELVKRIRDFQPLLNPLGVADKPKQMYCQMWFGKKNKDQVMKTKKCKKCVNPVWEDTFEKRMKGETVLKVRLYADDWMVCSTSVNIIILEFLIFLFAFLVLFSEWFLEKYINFCLLVIRSGSD